MSDQQRQENNRRLQEKFGQLQADPNTSADQWDALGMEYFVAGYILNAGVCFNRADAVRDAQVVIVLEEV